MTTKISTPSIVLDFQTFDQLTTSTTSAVTQVIPVHPFSTIRFITAAVAPSTGLNGVAVTISGSIDGGTIYDDTITTIAKHLSTSAANTKTVTSALYTHVKLAAMTSTSATTTVPAAELLARTKYIAK